MSKVAMVRILCLVDNTARLSSALWGEHGVSFWIEREETAVLFDTGMSGTVLLHNADTLGIPLQDVSALVLSHAHYDHTGGLHAFLSRHPSGPIYANETFFRPRYSLKQGIYRSIGLPEQVERQLRNMPVYLSTSPQEVIPGVWTTGIIRPRKEPEGRSRTHFVREGNAWVPDPYEDDLSLVIEAEAGLIVICGCCHAGLLNTLAHVQRVFARPIIAVLGGTHLVAADAAHLAHVAHVLEVEYPHAHLVLGHCTGWRATVYLAQALPDRVTPCAAGWSQTWP